MRIEVSTLDDVPENPESVEVDHQVLETESALDGWSFLTRALAEIPCEFYRFIIVEGGTRLRPDTDLALRARREALATDRMEEFTQAVLRRLGEILEPWDDWPKFPEPHPAYWQQAATWWRQVFEGAPLDEAVRAAVCARYGYIEAFD